LVVIRSSARAWGYILPTIACQGRAAPSREPFIMHAAQLEGAFGMTTTISTPVEEKLVLRDDVGGVATLTLNRPKQYNALSEELLAELQSALDAVAEDKSVRVVVIAGSGAAFCAGHDLKQMRANPRKEYYRKLFAQCSNVMLSITRISQPVIARVHGIATAAGCQLVAQCDLAVASDNASFAVSGINVGLFCSTPSVPLGRNLLRKQA